MAQTKTVDAVSKLVAILEPLDAQDRAKALQATLTLLDMAPAQIGVLSGGVALVQDHTSKMQPASAALNQFSGGGAKEFFASKDPKTKVEELAVAARYLEETQGGASCSQEQLKQTIVSARRNFDTKNFGRDIDNARRAAGLFNKSTQKDAYTLSYFGQKYVDTLPDRDALKTIAKKRPKRGTVKKAVKKALKK